MKRALASLLLLLALGSVSAQSNMNGSPSLRLSHPFLRWAASQQAADGGFGPTPAAPQVAADGPSVADPEVEPAADAADADDADAADAAAEPPAGAEPQAAPALAWTDERIASTGLVMFSMSVWGISPAHGRPRDRSTCTRGIDGLISAQHAESGRVGAAGPDDLPHTLATLALVEAWGLTRDPRHGHAATRAIAHLVQRQLEPDGWASTRSEHVIAWGLLALTAARQHGLDVDARAPTRAWLALTEQVEQALAGDAPRSDGRLYAAVAALLEVDGTWQHTALGRRAVAAMGAGPPETLWSPSGPALPRETLFWSLWALYQLEDDTNKAFRAYERRFTDEVFGPWHAALAQVFPDRSDTQAVVPTPPWTDAAGFALEGLAFTIFYRYDRWLRSDD